MKNLIPIVLAIVVPASSAAAQCGPIGGASFERYGTSCGPGFEPTALAGSFDPSACSLDVTLNTPVFGFNVILVGRMLALGFQPTATPVPFLGYGCSLWVVPATTFLQPPAQPTFSFPVPPAAWGATLYLQGANLWFDTIGFAPIYQVSHGLSATFF